MLVDANLLLYAADRASPHHRVTFEWLTGVLGATHRVGVPWASLAAFLRISTNPRASRRALDADEAWSFVDALLARETVWIPAPTARHGEVFARIMRRHGATGNLVPDAELAALAYEHGLTVYSADHDFARFDEVSWVDPLA